MEVSSFQGCSHQITSVGDRTLITTFENSIFNFHEN